jgi:uncharacterized membrane protein (DUF485 family)
MHMQDSISRTVEAIRRDPRFDELVRRRRRLSLTLLALVLGTYFGLTTLVAFAPGLLLRPVADGSLVTVGILFAVSVIVLGGVMTGVYVRRANTELDELGARVLAEARQ